ncbi:MAG TPA: M48 family metallopeptidase [Bacteroidota bacterium]|nr:M48 family metallopeptidase [Bacteroidota bacterium]
MTFRTVPFAAAAAFLSLCMLLQLAGCTTVAITGRKQLNLIPDGEMLSMSSQQYSGFLKDSRMSSDSASARLVKKVGARIQGAVERYFRDKGLASELAGYAWEFNLVQSDEMNAWCMPGGKVVFYSGILPVCRDESGIAVVMGHEVAHAVAEHGAERMSEGLLAQMGGTALSAALQSKPEQTQQLWMAAFGLGAQYGVLLPHSRGQESEADHLGLIFMAMAGYDPGASVSFWERMAAKSGGQKPPEFMSTHPSDETRINEIKQLLPEAMKYYQGPK